MVIKTRRGENIPGVDDLEEYQLGYSTDKKALYIKDPTITGTVDGTPEGEPKNPMVKLTFTDDELEGISDKIFDKRQVFYKRTITKIYSSKDKAEAALDSTTKIEGSWFDVRFENDFIIRYVGYNGPSTSGNIGVWIRSNYPNRLITYYSPEFYDGTGDLPTGNPAITGGGAIQTNHITLLPGVTAHHNKWFDMNDGYGILASNREIDEKYIYIRNENEASGHLYRLFNWVVKTETPNATSGNVRYEIVLYIQKIARKDGDTVNDGKVAQDDIIVQW